MTVEAWDKPEAKDAPNTARDPKKWARARRAATRKFGAKNSYVKNMWAVRWYNKRKGEWKKSLTDNTGVAVDWEKVLNEYGKNKIAYKEHKNDVDFLNPYVFVWSETEHMPMPNPTVDPNDLEAWTEAKKRAQGAKAQLVRFEKTFRWLRQEPGRVVTAQTLANLAPSGITADALATALGVRSEDLAQAQLSLDDWLDNRLSMAFLNKSQRSWLEPLRKDAPFSGEHQGGAIGDDDQKDTNRWGSGEKGGMRVRWDAAHNYMKPIAVHGKWDEIDPDDQAAIMFAHKMVGKEAELNSLSKDGKSHDWVVHAWLRPHQQRFFLQGLYQYQKHHENAASNRNSRWGPAARQRALQRAREHVAKVEDERYKIVTGEYKPFKLTDRYKHDKVQPGTIAARNIKENNNGHHAANEIDVDSKVLIPQQGQHGPTSYDQHENEVERQKAPRAAPGISGDQFMRESHSVAGVELGELFDAMKNAGLQRKQPEFRGMSARQAKRINAGLDPVSRKTWKDWQSWDRKPGETEDHFLSRKLSEFFMLREGKPNPSSWRTVLASFYNGQIDTSDGPIPVSNKMRHNFDRAAARMAVNRSVISREEEWGSLPFKVKWKYRVHVAHELHKNAHPERYGREEERDFARRRLDAQEQGQAVPAMRPPAQRRRRTAPPTPNEAALGGLPVDVVDNPSPEERGQSSARANLEAEIQRANREIANLARFYIRTRRVKLGAQAAYDAAQELIAANRLFARRQKRFAAATEAGGQPSARQQANFNQAQIEVDTARKNARAVFGRNFEAEVARAVARRREIDRKQGKLGAAQQRLREMPLNLSLKKLRQGLAKALVFEFVNKFNS